MKITWLGQAGLLFETEKIKIMVDPYLSDSVVKINPKNYRRVAVDPSFFEIKPDIMIFTHNHLDHYDPETASRYINEESGITVLAPASVFRRVQKCSGNNNYIRFDRHTEWTESNVKFTAVKAVHSDSSAIGVVIEAEGKNYYITGDTLYSKEIFSDLPDDIYAVFLPVNGLGNNMNMTDAARFAKATRARNTIPLHFGMFDNLDINLFDCENKVVPQIYKEIKLK